MLTDLMEPQQYPDRRAEDGTPQVPYDLAGWTLPLQMGVTVERVDAPFRASLQQLTTSSQISKPGKVSGSGSYGFVLSHNNNASIEATNMLMAAGEQVFWTDNPFSPGNTEYPAGSIVIKNTDSTAVRIDELARKSGLTFVRLKEEPAVSLHELSSPRIGLYKSWVANMDEGWTRWLLENYAFAVDTLHDVDMQTGNLEKYHAIILPSQNEDRLLNGHAEQTMPAVYAGGLGLEGALALKNYAESGGTVIALDAASDFVISQFWNCRSETWSKICRQASFSFPARLSAHRSIPAIRLAPACNRKQPSRFNAAGHLKWYCPTEQEKEAPKTSSFLSLQTCRPLLATQKKTC